MNSDETPDLPNQPFDALLAFTGCIAGAIPDICSYGLTIGDSYVPFNPDPDDECDDDAAMCSQLWVRVTSIVPVYGADGFGGDCGSVKRVGLEVGALRCLEIAEGGEAPSASEVLLASAQSMDDMNAIYCAAMECEVWDSIEVGEWTPLGPMGGQYGGQWTFSVEI